jgi:hypothetical protein
MLFIGVGSKYVEELDYAGADFLKGELLRVGS